MRIKKNTNCVHDFGKENSTVQILDNFMTMVVPDTTYGICVCCGKKFKINKNIKRKLKGKEELNDANVGGNESKAE